MLVATKKTYLVRANLLKTIMVTTSEIATSLVLVPFVPSYAYREFNANGQDVTKPFDASREMYIFFLFRLIFTLYLLFFAPVKNIFAQQHDYSFQHLTTKDGLVSDVARFICQDAKGFYWIGYDNGFQKFDGKNFINISFNNKYIEAGILSGLKPPVKDNEGNIFIYNQDSLYNYQTNGMVDTINIRENAPWKGRNLQAFCKDESGDIWIATTTYLYKYDKRKHACTPVVSLGKQKFMGSLEGLIYDGYKKCFWLAKDDNIFLIDMYTKQVTEPFFTARPGPTDLPKGITFTGFWMDSRRNLWIGSFNGNMYKYNTVTLKKEMFDVFNSNKNFFNRAFPLCFLEDNQKHVWIGCNNGGLYNYNEQSNTFYFLHANNNLANALHYNYYISALYQDNEGNIWIGTDKGINIFNPSQQQFKIVDENSSISDFQKTEITTIFETRKGNILIGTWGKGWWLFDKDFRLQKKFFETAKAPWDTMQRQNFVWCFGEDTQGKIWIGYQHGLIGIFNPVDQHINYIDVPEFKEKTIIAIQCDEKGNVWFGLHSGMLGKWDALQQKVFVYPHPPQAIDYPQPITDLLLDKKGDVWISTDGNGFYCFHPLTGAITDHYVDTGNNSIFDNLIHGLTKINDSLIGIANTYKGFILFNQKTKTFASFTVEKGMPDNNIYGLAMDRQNNLWVAASNALSRMSIRQTKTVSFDEEDGLFLKKFLGNITMLSSGIMVIPAETGFVYFSPDKVSDLPAPPDVTITGFTIFGKQMSIDSLFAAGKVISLDYTQNFFGIYYSSVSFLNRNSTKYYYQLEGTDKAWVNAGRRRFANYTNLNPGHYTFKVKCENREGIFSKSITALSIYIKPPWWATYWAYALYAFAAAGILYAIYRYRIQQIRHEQQAQINTMIATQEEERKRISRDLHDDVGTKLSAIKLFLSSLHEKASNTNNNEIKILAASSEQFVSETIKDVRQLLLNLSPSVLEEFGYTTAVEGLINKINETKQIQFCLVVFGMQQRLQKKYELALYRITQELINNVLKHAEAKNVSLQIGRRDNKIILMIEDDGKGFDINEHRDGYGLHNLEARTELLQGVMTIDSHLEKGTSILIEIPDNFN